MFCRSLILLAALHATAFADDKGERDLGRGFRLEVTKGGLVVIKGGVRAPLQSKVIELGKITTDATKVEADITDFTCVSSRHVTWTFAHLDARVQNTAAYRLHVANKYQEAAEGFARAAAADPSWVIPAYNLASAKVLLGDLDGAIAALASRLKSDPIATYVQISTDPELRPLLARPELAALRAKTAGTATLTPAARGNDVWSAPGLVAVDHVESSWGSSSFTVTVEIYDVKTGKQLASSELIRWEDTDPSCDTHGCELKPGVRAAIAARARQLQAMLDELGFSPAGAETVNVEFVAAVETTSKVYLDKAKLGVVATPEGTARVLRGNTVLATATGLHTHLARVTYLDGTRTFVLSTFHSTPEGCDGYPETLITVLPL
jgi:hypothetical protein